MPSLIRRRVSKAGKVVWQLRAPYTDPRTGEDRVLFETFTRQLDAKSALRRHHQKIEAGGVVKPADMTITLYLDQWLGAVGSSLRENTLESYRVLVYTYIIPNIGAVKLGDLTPAVIQKLYGDLTAAGLGARTVRYVHSVMRNALASAVTLQLLPQNPAAVGLKLPKQSRKESRALSEDEARRLLEAAQGDVLEPYFALALATGARPSELLGLQWKHVDLDEQVVRIEQTLVRLKGLEKWVLRSPKTKKGRRHVPIPSQVVEVLRRHKRHQAEERMAAGPAWTDHGFVFSTSVGTPLTLPNIRHRSLGRIQRAAGLGKDVTLYSMRHSCATLLLARGVNPKVVSERLGHANIGITLEVYGHVLPGMQADATATLAGMLWATSDPSDTRGRVEKVRSARLRGTDTVELLDARGSVLLTLPLAAEGAAESAG